MIRVVIEDYYIPMKDFKKYAKEREEYLKSLDNKYGTEFSTVSFKDVMKPRKENF